MEYSYLLKPRNRLSGNLEERFERLTGFVEVLCRRCDHDCQGFFLTAEGIEFDLHEGPKVGWVFYGDSVLLRIANCDNFAGILLIEEFIQKEGFVICTAVPERGN